MLINLRNALMAGKRLPYDAEVEFLESTGTQYINTNIKPGPNTRVEAVFAMTTFTANCGLFGARGSAAANNESYNLFIINNSGARVRWDWSGSGNYQISEAETSTAATYVLGAAGGNITRDGTTVMAVSSSKTAIDYPLYVFNMNNVGSPFATGANARFWSVKIYEGQTLVFDAIPVRVGTVGYLYDRVSGQLFGNAGTGDFVLGPDVVPVEYIESHGTEWIDTDKSVDLPMHLEADINFTNPNTGSSVQTFVGGYNASLADQRFWVTSLPQGKINCGLLTNSISTNLVPANRKVHLVVDFENGRQVATIDGVQYTSASQSTTNYWFRDWKVRIFQSFGTIIASNNIPLQAITNRINIDIGASQALRLLPIRVGSGTTWAGAMMDVLTRRVYRNAGTGAFTYGNDLPYPIPAA